MNQMLLFQGQKNQRTETLKNDPKSYSSRGTAGLAVRLLSECLCCCLPRLGQITRHDWTVFKVLNLRVAELGP